MQKRTKSPAKFEGYKLKRYPQEERLEQKITQAVRQKLQEHENSGRVTTSLEEDLQTLIK
jgi:hypothetical protein